MALLKKLKRFKVKNLFVCKIFAADNLKSVPYSLCSSTWNPCFLGFKILYGNDKILKDPIYGTKYVAKVDSFHPENNLYYNKMGNITDIFGLTRIGKKMKISSTKIEELNSVLEEVANKIKELQPN